MADEREDHPSAPAPDMAPAFAVGSASREEADAYLRKQARLAEEQTVLVRLQAEDLRREDRLRHWSLRVHHISDVMKLSFEFAVAIILVGLVVLLASAVWDAASDNGLVIESFSVPPNLAAKGITGQIVAAKVLDRLSAMQAATISSRAPSSYANNWGNDIKVEIPDTGISIGEFMRYLHVWLGHQTHITGDIYRNGKGYAVTARVGSTATPTYTGDDLDALVNQTASAIYRATQPYRYAMSLWSQSTFDPPTPATLQAIASLRALAVTGDTEDRAWASDAVGDFSLFQGDPAANIRWLKRSLAIEPGIDAYLDFGRAYGVMGHDQQLLNSADALLAFARHGGGTKILNDKRAADLLYTQQLVELLHGDNAQALKLALPLRRMADMKVTVGPYAELGKVAACAATHDELCVDETNDLDPIPPLWLVQADVTLGRYRKAASEEAALRTQLAALYKFGQLLARNQADPNLALAKAEIDDFKGAHALIDGAPADCDLCLRMRGRIAALEHRYDEAGRDFATVSARSPGIPFADTDWGAMLLRKGDLDGAIAKFDSANKKGPHFADPLEMWGEALIAKNRSDLALAKFEEAANYAPNWGRLHLKWGEALLWSTDKEGAQKQFALARTLDLTPAEKSELARVSHG
jgi:tetratricopeptide (TPR) repeat protein